MTQLGINDNTPLRFPGSKASRAFRLLRLADTDKRHYVEPFAGGLGVLFRCRRERLFRSYRVNDIDPRLVNFWTVLRDRPTALVTQLWQVYQRYGAGDAKVFEHFRNRLDHAQPVERAVAYYWVNKWTVRGGDRGGFLRTTKRRNGISPRMLDRLPVYAELLSGVVITCQDYREVSLPKTAFSFVDPPYETRSASFYRDEVDLEELRNWLTSQRGSWMLTLNDSPRTNALFSEYDIIVEPVRYPVIGVGCRPRELPRRDATEVVVTNYCRSTRSIFLKRFGWSVRRRSAA